MEPRATNQDPPEHTPAIGESKESALATFDEIVGGSVERRLKVDPMILWGAWPGDEDVEELMKALS